MMILALAPIAVALIGLVAAFVAGHIGKGVIADIYEKKAGLLTAKNRRRFEAEIDKLADLMRTREGKKELAKQGINLEQALLSDLSNTLPPSPGEGAPVDESVPPLGPTGGLEVDEGALLAESLGVSQEQVKRSARPPTPPALSLFGGPG